MVTSLPEELDAELASSSISNTLSMDFWRFCAWVKAVLANEEKLEVSNQLICEFLYSLKFVLCLHFEMKVISKGTKIG